MSRRAVASEDRLAYAADHSTRLRDALRHTGRYWRGSRKAAIRAEARAAAGLRPQWEVI